MKRPVLTIALLLLAGAGYSLHAAPAAEDATVIARVGDNSVTAAEIRDAVRNLDANSQAAIARDPSQLSQVVRAILTRRLVLQEADSKKWDQNPAAAAQIARARDNALVETYLESVSMPPDSYPSQSELQAAYDANKSALLMPRQYRLAQIFIKCPKSADADTAAKAQVKLDGIRKRLKQKDADFSTVARANSDEPQSAAQGGEIGWVAENRIQPEIRTQLGSLEKGTVSDPVRLDDGWHILKVLDQKAPYTPELGEVKQQLAARMRQQKAQANSQEYVAKLLQQSPVEINEIELSKVLKP